MAVCWSPPTLPWVWTLPSCRGYLGLGEQLDSSGLPSQRYIYTSMCLVEETSTGIYIHPSPMHTHIHTGGINHMVPCLCCRTGRGLQSLSKWVSSFPHYLPPNQLPSVCGISVHPRWDCHQESKLWYRHSTEGFNVWGGWLSILDYCPGVQ